MFKYKKTKRLFRKLLPQTLFSRFFLIIVIPALIVQLMASYMFYVRHWSSISTNMARALAGEVSWVIDNLEKDPNPHHEMLIKQAHNTLSFNMRLDKRTHIIPKSLTSDNTLLLFKDALKQQLHYPYAIRLINANKNIEILIQLPQSTVCIITSSKRLTNPTTSIFISWVVGTGALMLLISLLFLRTQIRSIRRMAEAADQFGKGQEVTWFRPQGAIEIRKAAEAFLKMKHRIHRMVTQRTELLAGVSHDLRTPLTRMTLQLVLLESAYPEAVSSLKQDINDMEHMIQEYLDFAKGSGEEQPKAVHIPTLLDDIVTPYQNHGSHVNCTTIPDITIPVREQAIKRVLTNLIDNATRFGSMVEISGFATSTHLHLQIDDNGPGIPLLERANVFKPFYRLEPGRNLKHGGVGLGLAIAKDLIVGHGGTIRIDESPSKGTRVSVTLPC